MREPQANEVALFQGGWAQELLRKLFRRTREPSASRLRILIVVAIVWLPTVALATLDSVIHPRADALSIGRDVLLHVRSWISIPLLLALELSLPRSLAEIMALIEARELVPEKARAEFEKAKRAVTRPAGARGVELVLLAVAILIAIERGKIEYPGFLHSWRSSGSWLSSLAHQWDLYVAYPIYYFLILRWVWKFSLWSQFLVRFTATRPRLKTGHPDQRGGLSFIGYRHLRFSIVVLALSATAAARVWESTTFDQIPLSAFILPVLVYAVTIDSILLAPLLAFTPGLLRLRRMDLERYGTFAQRYVRSFDQKWLERPAQEVEDPLGHPDIQSLNDLDGSYAHHRETSVLLVGRRSVAPLILMTIVPFLPLILLVFPLKEILKLVLRLIG